MRIAIMLLVVAMLYSCERDEVLPPEYYTCGNDWAPNAPDHPKEQDYLSLMEYMTGHGVPGVQLSVQTGEYGLWNSSLGYADLAAGSDMEACHITRAGSTVKTFTAVTILMLCEDGKMGLDDAVTEFLTPDQIRGLKNAEKSTVRQLLIHSSGIYNYIQSAQFQTASLNDLSKVWQPDELLEYARDREPYFEPGEDVKYSNTNYILLGMIIEEVTGKPFYKVFEERIFNPLNMTSTQFAAEDPVPDGIVRGYVDLYSNLNLINATNYSGWDYYTADGGLISNAHDLNVFLHALFNGEIITAKSMSHMLDWQEPKDQDSEGFPTAYGLGIFKIETTHGPAYLHSGDAIGYFASMVHFPNQNVTISWAANGNYGKLDTYTQSKEAMERVFLTVLED